ncbi:hypothetical protein RZN22_08450 [Bacillaceae bacterium S4-13-58]
MSRVFENLPIMEQVPVLPTLTFENHLTIYGSERKVELHCFGGGHTASDAFLYLPQEKIAFMGDIATENLHLPIHNPDDFLTILEKLNEFEIEKVVPGHGEIGTLEICEILHDYLLMLVSRAKDAHRNRISLEDFVSSFEIPTEYKQWRGVNGIKTNLVNVYTFYLEK